MLHAELHTWEDNQNTATKKRLSPMQFSVMWRSSRTGWLKRIKQWHLLLQRRRSAADEINQSRLNGVDDFQVTVIIYLQLHLNRGCRTQTGRRWRENWKNTLFFAFAGNKKDEWDCCCCGIAPPFFEPPASSSVSVHLPAASVHGWVWEQLPWDARGSLPRPKTGPLPSRNLQRWRF